MMRYEDLEDAMSQSQKSSQSQDVDWPGDPALAVAHLAAIYDGEVDSTEYRDEDGELVTEAWGWTADMALPETDFRIRIHHIHHTIERRLTMTRTPIRIESTGEYHDVTLFVRARSFEVRGGFDKDAAWAGCVAAARGDIDEATELYTVAVAEAAQEIAGALADAGVCEGPPQIADDGPAGARVTAVLQDGRRIEILVDGAASSTGPSVSVYDVTPA